MAYWPRMDGMAWMDGTDYRAQRKGEHGRLCDKHHTHKAYLAHNEYGYCRLCER